MAGIAELLVLLKATDQMSPVINSAKSSISGFESATLGVGKALAGVVTTAAVAGVAGLAAGFGSAVHEAANFEKVMSGVKAVSGSTAEEMSQLSGLALKLGADTSFSATEAGLGIEELVKAGVSIADVMGGAAAASLNLAAAGNISVAESATIASNAMNAFGIKGSEAGHVADIIAGAANASAIDVHEFGFSLSAAGAVANTVGFSFDDLATAIAIMGQAGIKGSDAGTSLKTMMLNLQPTTKAQIGLFRDLGITTADGANRFFDASGKVRSFAEVAEVLQDALHGLTEQQRLAALEVIFGSDAIRAGAVIAKAGSDGFYTMADAMSKVTAQQVAEERLNNLAGSLEKLKGSLQTAAIVIGSAFLPGLRSMVDGITNVLNEALPGMQGFAEAAATNFGATFTAITTAAAGPIRLLKESFLTMVQVFQGQWAPDATQIEPFVNAVGIATIVVRDQLLPAVMTMVEFFASHTEIIVGFAAAFATLLTLGVIASTIAAVAAAIAFLLSPIGLVLIAVGLLTAAWVGNWGDIQGITARAAATVGAAVAAITGFLTSVGDFFSTLVSTVAAAWQSIVDATSSAATGLTSAVETAWSMVQAAVDTALAAIGTAVVAAWETIFTGETRAALAALVTDFQTTWDAITGLVAAATGLLQTTVSAANTAVATDVTTKWASITTVIGSAMTAIQTTAETGWTAVQTTTGSILTALSAEVGTIWDGLTPIISSAMTSVSSAVMGAWESIRSGVAGIISGIVSAAGNAGSAMVQTFAQGIISKMQSALGAVRQLADEIKSLLPHSDADKGPLSTLTDQGRALPATLAKGIAQGTPSLLRAVSSMASDMTYNQSAGGGATLGAVGSAPSAINISVTGVGLDEVADAVMRKISNAVMLGILPSSGFSGVPR